MTKCATCGKENERKGGIMIPVCQPCLDKRAADPEPDFYVMKNGLFVVNDDHKAWRERQTA